MPCRNVYLPSPLTPWHLVLGERVDAVPRSPSGIHATTCPVVGFVDMLEHGSTLLVE